MYRYYRTKLDHDTSRILVVVAVKVTTLILEILLQLRSLLGRMTKRTTRCSLPGNGAQCFDFACAVGNRKVAGLRDTE
jgi:hypothetical protein